MIKNDPQIVQMKIRKKLAGRQGQDTRRYWRQSGQAPRRDRQVVEVKNQNPV
jgi:hypothetical protein